MSAGNTHGYETAWWGVHLEQRRNSPPDKDPRFAQPAIDQLPTRGAGGVSYVEIEVDGELPLPEYIVVGQTGEGTRGRSQTE
jgi:hypothetical protein